MRIIKSVITTIIGITVLGLLIYSASDIQVVPPNELVVLADHKYETYISPECLNPNIDYETEDFEVVQWNYATDELDYTMDSECTYDSIWPSRNGLWDFIGVKLGVIKPLNWKWNDDGTWKEEVFE